MCFSKCKSANFQKFLFSLYQWSYQFVYPCYIPNALSFVACPFDNCAECASGGSKCEQCFSRYYWDDTEEDCMRKEPTLFKEILCFIHISNSVTGLRYFMKYLTEVCPKENVLHQYQVPIVSLCKGNSQFDSWWHWRSHMMNKCSVYAGMSFILSPAHQVGSQCWP